MKRLCSLLLLFILSLPAALAAPLSISPSPLFLGTDVAPLTMLVMSRDHKLFFEAYNDATDIDGDGVVETQFKPSIDYYGYFDSYKCYNYSGGRFVPASLSPTKTCSGAWSGNFLNYLTTARIDALRKVLVGGDRFTDSDSLTVLQRTFIPQEGHSWGRDYTSTSTNGYDISLYTPFAQPTSGRFHLFVNTTPVGTTTPLLRVLLNQTERIWNWVGIKAPVAGTSILNSATNARTTVTPTDYIVRVEVCNSAIGLEPNCRVYPKGNFKPIGLIQEFGENGSMYFGLMTGSYVRNLSGGVLRREIGPLMNNSNASIRNEINPENGVFLTGGMIQTINQLSIVDFSSSFSYNNCSLYYNQFLSSNGECRSWGNPISEMMYETLRYFSGKRTPTSTFNYSGSDAISTLPKVNSWLDPYAVYPACSKANMVIISDTAPTYDFNTVPGSSFSSFSGDMPINVTQLAGQIFSGEGFAAGTNAFIGQVQGQTSDGAPTAKSVSTFGNVRGIGIQESNARGSFYSASIAYYGWINDLHQAKGKQNVKTFSLALSDFEPHISFNVAGKTVEITPFARTTRVVKPFLDFPNISISRGNYQPVATLIEFYALSQTPTGGVYRAHFHDLQQGGDFDSDGIVTYTVNVIGDQITVTVQSEPSDSRSILHMGYHITGTTADGVYLEVRNTTLTTFSFSFVTQNDLLTYDERYFMDTGTPSPSLLGTSASKSFTAGNSNITTFQSPLWYAAKWGGFNDLNNNAIPDLRDEYITEQGDNPDNYFLVTNALKLRDQLSKIFQLMIDRTGSFASAALSSGFLAQDTQIYQALFQTKDWSGQLLAFKINPNNGQILYNGSAPQGAIWDTAQQLKSVNRNLVTYHPTLKRGIPFRWLNLDATQQAALNTNPDSGAIDALGPLRLEYLRGSQSNELKQGGSFRNRSTLLGDIINSAPISVSAPSSNYPILWSEGFPESQISYASFRMTYLNRTPVIYVGANDGMLHAINATNGNELFGFIPSSVYGKITDLTSLKYVHRFFVDGSPSVADVLMGGAWRTVLVGGLNAGGQGIYALNITDPSQFTEANAQNIVLWEFTDANDRDLGFTYSQPAIVRLNNGRWAAIFGNGFNNTNPDAFTSTTGNAVLYIVDIQTGALIKKFDTGVGMAQDPLLSIPGATGNIGRPNGMATPAIVDIDGNSIADFIYVGDLFGNLWKIDISGNSPNQWDFSFKSRGNPAPFYRAIGPDGYPQPITTKPTVARINFSTTGLQIFIGTGKYIETSDKTDTRVQSVYALRDNGAVITGRTNLQQQRIVQEADGFRAVSNELLANNQLGWYLDLVYNNEVKGERIISNMIYKDRKLIFTTIVPSESPCEYGGTSWLMELNAFTGARLNYNVFDINNDGLFDSQDSVTASGVFNGTTISGQSLGVGLVSAPAILNAGGIEYKYLPGTSGGIQTINESPGIRNYGRQSWRQLQ